MNSRAMRSVNEINEFEGKAVPVGRSSVMQVRWKRAAFTAAAVLALAGCGSTSSGTAASETTAPVSAETTAAPIVETSAPVEETTAATEPSTTETTETTETTAATPDDTEYESGDLSARGDLVTLGYLCDDPEMSPDYRSAIDGLSMDVYDATGKVVGGVNPTGEPPFSSTDDAAGYGCHLPVIMHVWDFESDLTTFEIDTTVQGRFPYVLDDFADGFLIPLGQS